MNIKFNGTKVTRFSLVVVDNNDSELNDDFKLTFVNTFLDEDNSFTVQFTALISSKEENFVMEIEYIGNFSSEETMTEEFKQSHFPSVNAPAIAYPFLRSFVSTVSVNANLNPVILPTINFQELVRQQNKSSELE